MAKRHSYAAHSVIFFGIVVVLMAAFIVLPGIFGETYSVATDGAERDPTTETMAAPALPVIPPVAHIKTPSAVKGIYMTNCAASTASYRDRLTKLIEETELNSVIIDIKDFSGAISFTPDNPNLLDYAVSNCPVKDMKELVAMLHEKGIYVIGRVTVFQDPLYAKLHPDTAVKTASTGATWKDRKGISFVDVSSKEVWDHTIAIAKESYALGFDEINFDYIRFPSDGNMRDIAFPHSGDTPKAVALEKFFTYLHEELKDTGIVTSADLFGMVTTASDDMGIGQIFEAAIPYFDYIMPMVYPSHYPATFNGWQNPNAHPYELIKFVMGAAVRRAEAPTTLIKTLESVPDDPSATSTPKIYKKEVFNKLKLRTWIQDFDLGQPAYGAKEVRDQIQATYDVGLTSWLVWDASNKYSPGAFLAQLRQQ